MPNGCQHRLDPEMKKQITENEIDKIERKEKKD